MASSSHPIIVIVPGAALTPSHYAYLLHLLHSQGYGTFSAPLPSTVGGSKPVTVEDDTEFVRSQMLLPVMDTEQHDVVIVTHSYSGIPGSAACHGLGKTERASKGYKTSVIGQISIASVLVKGGDGKDPVAKFGGELPPHIQADVCSSDQQSIMFSFVQTLSLTDFLIHFGHTDEKTQPRKPTI